MYTKKICLFLLVFMVLAVPFRAMSDSREQESNSLESNSLEQESGTGISSDRVINLTVSSLPEAKIGFVQGFTFPFLRGGSVLTAGNNFRTTLTAEVSPVSLDGIVEGILTPIAFLQLAAGFRIGTGWNVTLFGGDLHGIGINRPGAGGKAETAGSAFDGIQWKAHFGGALQFDMAAVFPGDWHHIVFRSYHEINYRGYSAASKDDSWFLENDAGENRNGFSYYGNFLAGYQMPFFFNMAAVLVEMDKFLYDTPNRENWGDDLIRWTFSAVLNFTVTDRIGAALIPQWRAFRNYNGFDPDVFYQNRSLDRANPLRLEFYRVVAILTFKLP